MWKPTSLLLLSNLCLLSQALLPSYDLSREENQNNQLLFDDGGQVGAFIIKNVGSKYAQAVENVIKKAPDCLDQDYPALPKFQMNDGSTRTTFASNSTKEDIPSCVAKDLEVVIQTFDQVQDIVSDIIGNITGETVQYQDIKGQKVGLKKSPFKEHLHVYRKESLIGHEDEHWMVPFHVDNGFFLLLTPFQGHGLKIKTSTGTIVDTDHIPTDSVLVLMGRGLTDWLLKDKSISFHAVPHAVESRPNMHSRSVFARMKVAPMDAMPMDQTVTFSNVFFNNDARVLGKVSNIHREMFCNSYI